MGSTLAIIRNAHHPAIGMFVFVLIIFGLTVLVSRRARARRSSQGPGSPSNAGAPQAETSGSSAERILSERFARGEIDLVEYRESLVALRGDSANPGGRGHAPTA